LEAGSMAQNMSRNERNLQTLSNCENGRRKDGTQQRSGKRGKEFGIVILYEMD